MDLRASDLALPQLLRGCSEGWAAVTGRSGPALWGSLEGGEQWGEGPGPVGSSVWGGLCVPRALIGEGDWSSFQRQWGVRSSFRQQTIVN